MKTRRPRLHATSDLRTRSVAGLAAFAGFFAPKNPAAAKRAAASIITAIGFLVRHPQIGRPIEGMEGMEITHRELLIDFGDSGYVALYRLEGELITVLALRHQKETGYAQ